MFDSLTQAAQSLGNDMTKNPAPFAIALDMLGSKIAPDNPFAGIGTHFGQSALADKGAQETKRENKDLINRLIGALTEGGKPGGNQISVKMGPEGRPIVSTSTTLSPDKLEGGPVKAPEATDPHNYLDSIAIK